MPFPNRFGMRRIATSTVWMAAHAFFEANTSLAVSFYARSIDVEDRCTASNFFNDWFPTRTRFQCESHHASWWKVKKVVLDQSVLFDEVIGGTLQRAFALCIFLFCSARALVKTITRWRFCRWQRHQHLHISLLVIWVENWATTSRLKKT